MTIVIGFFVVIILVANSAIVYNDVHFADKLESVHDEKRLTKILKWNFFHEFLTIQLLFL